VLIALAVLFGFVVAVIRGGKLAALADLHVRAGWLALAALALQVAVFTRTLPPLPNRLVVPLHLASYLLLLLFLITNICLPRLWLPAIGFALNLIVIAANGGRMPVAPGASTEYDKNGALSQINSHSNVFLADSQTHLRWLGDILPVPIQPFANTVSIGDLILLIGVIGFVHRATHPWSAPDSVDT
jgi:hypothetical protein